MPGQENIVSVKTAPANSAGRSRARIVTTGEAAFFKPCFQITRGSGVPLARAVRMKSCPITSSMLARVYRV